MKKVTKPPSLPPRPLDGHKGTFGRVLVVGGSDGMLGAPVLAATAALHMGSGLVQLAIDAELLPAALTITPELIGLGLGRKDDQKQLEQAAEKADALVVGPGLGQSRDALTKLSSLVRMNKPAVIDADALNLIAKMKSWPKCFKAKAVLTPHPGEMARLGKLIGRTEVPSDNAGRIEIATEAARSFGQVLLLKGNRTVVTDGERVYINRTGNSALAKAGAGDVLSGVIGSLLGQGMAPFEAASLGAYLHGRAGEIVGEDVGLRSVLARDVIEALSDAMVEYEVPESDEPF